MNVSRIIDCTTLDTAFIEAITGESCTTLCEIRENIQTNARTYHFDVDLSNANDFDIEDTNNHVQEQLGAICNREAVYKEWQSPGVSRVRKVSLERSNVTEECLFSPNALRVAVPLHIQSLNMSYTQVTPMIFKLLRHLPSLKELQLNGCLRIDKLPRSDRQSTQNLCPAESFSLRKIYLVGAPIQHEVRWQKKLTQRFPNLELAEVTVEGSIVRWEKEEIEPHQMGQKGICNYFS